MFLTTKKKNLKKLNELKQFAQKQTGRVKKQSVNETNIRPGMFQLNMTCSALDKKI